MEQNNTYTKTATANFLKAVNLVKFNQPTIAGEAVKTDGAICKHIGMHQSSFSHIGSGLRDVTLDQLATFCAIFNFSLEAMVYEGEPKKVDTNLTKTLENISLRLDALEATSKPRRVRKSALK